jgi:hypothetical protein
MYVYLFYYSQLGDYTISKKQKNLQETLDPIVIIAPGTTLDKYVYLNLIYY